MEEQEKFLLGFLGWPLLLVVGGFVWFVCVFVALEDEEGRLLLFFSFFLLEKPDRGSLLRRISGDLS